MYRQYIALSPHERFWPKVEFTDTCWLWRGAVTSGGYGNFTLSTEAGTRRNVAAHRFSYLMLVGPIAEGYTLDHLCRVHNCVLPEHLEEVTNRENILRGQSFAATYARATRCVNGHEFTPENTGGRARPEGGRTCLACRTISNARVSEKRKLGLLKSGVHKNRRVCSGCRMRREVIDGLCRSCRP